MLPQKRTEMTSESEAQQMLCHIFLTSLITCCNVVANINHRKLNFQWNTLFYCFQMTCALTLSLNSHQERESWQHPHSLRSPSLSLRGVLMFPLGSRFHLLEDGERKMSLLIVKVGDPWFAVQFRLLVICTITTVVTVSVG